MVETNTYYMVRDTDNGYYFKGNARYRSWDVFNKGTTFIKEKYAQNLLDKIKDNYPRAEIVYVEVKIKTIHDIIEEEFELTS